MTVFFSYIENDISYFRNVPCSQGLLFTNKCIRSARCDIHNNFDDVNFRNILPF